MHRHRLPKVLRRLLNPLLIYDLQVRRHVGMTSSISYPEAHSTAAIPVELARGDGLTDDQCCEINSLSWVSDSDIFFEFVFLA